jgi:hypothetical protein
MSHLPPNPIFCILAEPVLTTSLILLKRKIRDLKE